MVYYSAIKINKSINTVDNIDKSQKTLSSMKEARPKILQILWFL